MKKKTPKIKTAAPSRKKKPGVFPSLKKEVSLMLNSEEAKISTRGVITGAITLFSLGIAADALSSHGNWHDNYGPHSNSAPHHSFNTGHVNVWPHNSSNPHVSVAPHNSYLTPHANTHANVNEATTVNTVHNNTADGYGKHVSSLGHNNVPNIHANTATHTNTAPHYNVLTHANVAPHYNVGHHGSAAPHQNIAPHHSAHNSHGSHGQW